MRFISAPSPLAMSQSKSAAIADRHSRASKGRF
jgi:hypothetical protein